MLAPGGADHSQVFPHKVPTSRMGATLARQLSSRGGAGYRAHPQGARGDGGA
jgi:hypothetical protein